MKFVESRESSDSENRERDARAESKAGLEFIANFMKFVESREFPNSENRERDARAAEVGKKWVEAYNVVQKPHTERFWLSAGLTEVNKNLTTPAEVQEWGEGGTKREDLLASLHEKEFALRQGSRGEYIVVMSEGKLFEWPDSPYQRGVMEAMGYKLHAGES